MKKVYQEGDLRVWHIPQVPMKAFHVSVVNVQEARKILNILADYDLFQFENNVKPDYSNVGGLEQFINGEWVQWEDELGDNIFQSTKLQNVEEK